MVEITHSSAYTLEGHSGPPSELDNAQCRARSAGGACLIPALGAGRQERQEFKICLGYKRSCGPALVWSRPVRGNGVRFG